MIAFGPVPSRRLGRSLGINNIPPKHCTYSCAYCQVGRTSNLDVRRRPFYNPQVIFEAVKEKVDRSRELSQAIDYLTFVPDGEPTLDVNLGEEIDLLKPLGIRIAVISNATLITDEQVRRELSKADWVSLKVDSVDEEKWRKINRPNRSLVLEEILEGMLEFGRNFEGKLVTETMLIRDVNDGDSSLQNIADFLAGLKPEMAYISVPTRPPAQSWALPPDEDKIARAYCIFEKNLKQVELLTGYEGDTFSITGDLASDILSISAVHPIREDALNKLLETAGSGWQLIEKLIDEGQLKETEYEGNKFYLRKPRLEKLVEK
ncbi:MAG: radical SAM protein [Methanotrichaceae archaeon]|nr:radical SAM protein [Methanotrichaceae archaeon]